MSRQPARLSSLESSPGFKPFTITIIIIIIIIIIITMIIFLITIS